MDIITRVGKDGISVPYGEYLVERDPAIGVRVKIQGKYYVPRLRDPPKAQITSDASSSSKPTATASFQMDTQTSQGTQLIEESSSYAPGAQRDTISVPGPPSIGQQVLASETAETQSLLPPKLPIPSTSSAITVEVPASSTASSNLPVSPTKLPRLPNMKSLAHDVLRTLGKKRPREEGEDSASEAEGPKGKKRATDDDPPNSSSEHSTPRPVVESAFGFKRRELLARQFALAQSVSATGLSQSFPAALSDPGRHYRHQFVSSSFPPPAPPNPSIPSITAMRSSSFRFQAPPNPSIPRSTVFSDVPTTFQPRPTPATSHASAFQSSRGNTSASLGDAITASLSRPPTSKRPASDIASGQNAVASSSSRISGSSSIATKSYLYKPRPVQEPSQAAASSSTQAQILTPSPAKGGATSPLFLPSPSPRPASSTNEHTGTLSAKTLGKRRVEVELPPTPDWVRNDLELRKRLYDQDAVQPADDVVDVIDEIEEIEEEEVKTLTSLG